MPRARWEVPEAPRDEVVGASRNRDGEKDLVLRIRKGRQEGLGGNELASGLDLKQKRLDPWGIEPEPAACQDLTVLTEDAFLE